MFCIFMTFLSYNVSLQILIVMLYINLKLIFIFFIVTLIVVLFVVFAGELVLAWALCMLGREQVQDSSKISNFGYLFLFFWK